MGLQYNFDLGTYREYMALLPPKPSTLPNPSIVPFTLSGINESEILFDDIPAGEIDLVRTDGAAFR